jgi:CBS domain-containing protein
MRVKEILMTKGSTVFTINPEASIMAAAQRLTDHNIGAIIVVDDRKRPVGILSERDIVREISKQGADVMQKPVSALMTSKVIVAVPEDELAMLSNTMTEKRIRHIPVVENDELVGIISIGDVVKSQIANYEGQLQTLRYMTE